MSESSLGMRGKKRIAVVYNVPIACNRATADCLLSSPLMGSECERLLPRNPPRPGA